MQGKKGILKFWGALVVVLGFFSFSSFMVSPALAFSGSGSGTSSDPFQVTTCSQLQSVANALTASYLQKNDIDCTGVTFVPIGDGSHLFNGTYNGNGFKIMNLTINSSASSVGLFGETGSSAVITKVGLASGSVFGTDLSPIIGTVVGFNRGTISQSYSTIPVEVNSNLDATVGGFAGDNNGTISDCYATGSVKSDSSGVGTLGGFAGESAGDTVRSYSTGNVVGGSTDGGFVGYIGSGDITNIFTTSSVDLSAITVNGMVGTNGGTIVTSYWNKTSGSPTNCSDLGNTGCTAINNNVSYFYTVTNAPMSSWDFSTVWSSQNNGSNYPILKWQEVVATPTPTSGVSSSSSVGVPGPVAVSCTSAAPGGAPNLFALTAKNGSATLYFAPVSGANTKYVISYGVTESADMFATSFDWGDMSGVVPYSVHALFPGTWYFKVRGQDGCMPGNWSRVMKVFVR